MEPVIIEWYWLAGSWCLWCLAGMLVVHWTWTRIIKLKGGK